MEWSKGRVYLGGGVLVRGGRLSVVLCVKIILGGRVERNLLRGAYIPNLCVVCGSRMREVINYKLFAYNV